MVAAENGALTGGKVGGVADVLRDVPRALARMGHRVSVITPGYMSLSARNPSHKLGELRAPFCGQSESLTLYRCQAQDDPLPAGSHGTVEQYLLDHSLFAACGAGAIYCHDGYGPFATDAHKFALFCAGVAEWLNSDLINAPDVIHLHDWHSAVLAILRTYHPRYLGLRSIRTVFSIHNLSLQGIRPMRGDASSLQNWFPDLQIDTGRVGDPRFPDCVNLMRSALTLSDHVHVVSPGYLTEVLKPSDPERGFIGGEGLEKDLQLRHQRHELSGILNGCEYPKRDKSPIFPKIPLDKLVFREVAGMKKLCTLIGDTVENWTSGKDYIPVSYLTALRRVEAWSRRRKSFPLSLTSIGRLTDQKVALLLLQHEGRLVLEVVLEKLAERDGVLIMVGTGDESSERLLARLMQRHENFLYLQGYSEQLADHLYGAGDLFLMPSSFEPCGISQMLAMRAGTPCLVHQVGGLKDTVVPGVNGFGFKGDSANAQASAMLENLDKACDEILANSEKWQQLREGARAVRFDWEKSVTAYLTEMYQPDMRDGE